MITYNALASYFLFRGTVFSWHLNFPSLQSFCYLIFSLAYFLFLVISHFHFSVTYRNPYSLLIPHIKSSHFANRNIFYHIYRLHCPALLLPLALSKTSFHSFMSTFFLTLRGTGTRKSFFSCYSAFFFPFSLSLPLAYLLWDLLRM